MEKANYTLICFEGVNAQLENYVALRSRDLCQYVTKPFTVFVDRYGGVKLALRNGELIFEGDSVGFGDIVHTLRRMC